MGDDSAHTLKNRLRFCMFDGADASALEEFDVAKAHCYDPNEEKKLRSVISLLGAARFNNRVRGLAKTAFGNPRKATGDARPTSAEDEAPEARPAESIIGVPMAN